MATISPGWAPPTLPEAPCVHGRPWRLFFHFEPGDGIELFAAPCCEACHLLIGGTDAPYVEFPWPFLDEEALFSELRDLGFRDDERDGFKP
jgi:hypothetical protein